MRAAWIPGLALLACAPLPDAARDVPAVDPHTIWMTAPDPFHKVGEAMAVGGLKVVREDVKKGILEGRIALRATRGSELGTSVYRWLTLHVELDGRRALFTAWVEGCARPSTTDCPTSTSLTDRENAIRDRVAKDLASNSLDFSDVPIGD